MLGTCYRHVGSAVESHGFPEKLLKFARRCRAKFPKQPQKAKNDVTAPKLTTTVDEQNQDGPSEASQVYPAASGMPAKRPGSANDHASCGTGAGAAPVPVEKVRTSKPKTPRHRRRCGLPQTSRAGGFANQHQNSLSRCCGRRPQQRDERSIDLMG